jgi:ankyrin repeat protein
MLLKAGAINAEGGRYGTALYVAVQRDHKEVVQMLLKAGADVNVERWEYDIAPQVAAPRGDKEVVQMLVEAGVQSVSTILV